MSIYYYDLPIFIGTKAYFQRIYYAMPYIPVTNHPIWDEKDPLHKSYSDLSKCIYSSKYKDSSCHYYLFKKDLYQGLHDYVSASPNFSCILPIGSNHRLVQLFAEYLNTLTSAPIIDCIHKIDKNEFAIKPNTFLPKGKILVIDDITTSGKAIEAAITELSNQITIDVSNIHVLCIAKTERNLYEWDDNKLIS